MAEEPCGTLVLGRGPRCVWTGTRRGRGEAGSAAHSTVNLFLIFVCDQHREPCGSHDGWPRATVAVPPAG